MKSSTKAVWLNFLLPALMVFLYWKWTIYMTMSPTIILKILERLFWFGIGIGVYSFCRAFYGTSFKTKLNVLSFSQVEIYVKQKLFERFSIWWEVILSWWLFILSIIKAIRTDKNDFSHAVFVELFMAHLLVKNSRFYHLLNLRYIQNKKCYNIMGAL